MNLLWTILLRFALILFSIGFLLVIALAIYAIYLTFNPSDNDSLAELDEDDIVYDGEENDDDID